MLPGLFLGLLETDAAPPMALETEKWREKGAGDQRCDLSWVPHPRGSKRRQEQGKAVKNKMRPQRLDTRSRGNEDTTVRMSSRLITRI